jgi:hypothetical protein
MVLCILIIKFLGNKLEDKRFCANDKCGILTARRLDWLGHPLKLDGGRTVRMMRDLRFPPRCRCDLHSSGILRSVEW